MRAFFMFLKMFKLFQYFIFFPIGKFSSQFLPEIYLYYYNIYYLPESFPLNVHFPKKGFP